MNRELWLLRHGKAERFDTVEDYDRKLKKRGKNDARLIGEWMRSNGFIPDAIISSPAARAIGTAKIICDALEMDRHEIQQDKRLYDEGVVRVRSVLAECPPSLGCVLLVGHNPELEDLLRNLVDSADLPDVDKLIPTAGFMGVVMPDDWSKLQPGCAQLRVITYPQGLRQEHAD